MKVKGRMAQARPHFRGWQHGMERWTSVLVVPSAVLLMKRPHCLLAMPRVGGKAQPWWMQQVTVVVVVSVSSLQDKVSVANIYLVIYLMAELV